MKRILVVATYEAYVPEDMTIDSLRDNIEDTFENRFDDFGVSSKGYHDEDLEWVIFRHEDTAIGTSMMLSIKEE